MKHPRKAAPRPTPAPVTVPTPCAVRPRKGTPQTAAFLDLFAAIVREQQQRAQDQTAASDGSERTDGSGAR